MTSRSNLVGGDHNPIETDPAADARLLERLFEVAADALLVVDSQMIIRRANIAASHIFGYAAQDLLGQSIDLLIPGRYVAAHHRQVRDFAESDVNALIMGNRGEIVALRKGGEEFPAEATISKLVENGKSIYMVILRDSTQRKQLEHDLGRSEERFRRVFNYSNDAIFIIEPTEQRFVDVNPKACTMFGFSRDEFNTLTVADIHPTDSQKFEVFAKSVISQGVGWTDELTCLTKSGSLLPAEVSASIIDVGDRRLMVAIFRDISERKQAERMQHAFVSNVSHELRTPITSIKLYHELLQRRGDRQEEYLERLTNETNRLQHLIDDLLDISRLDQDNGPIRMGRVDLNGLVEEYVRDRQVLAESQSLTLSAQLVGELPVIHGDERLLGQTLSILLTNAFNYTSAGGKVVVGTMTQDADGRRWAGFCVSDTGMGIQSEELDQLFDRFYRGSAGEQSGAPGTGLGLSIAREIVSRHAGWIDTKSPGMLGCGSTFTVWLPAEV